MFLWHDHVIVAMKVKMKKTSKSAPGNLAKGTQSKAKSQAGQAADAAAAEALAATTPPASTTGDSAVDSVSRKKKGKSLKGESDSQRDQVTTPYSFTFSVCVFHKLLNCCSSSSETLAPPQARHLCKSDAGSQQL